MDAGLSLRTPEYSVRHIAHAVAIGAVCGLLAVVQSIGFGTLLFSGLPSTLSSSAAGMALLSSAVIALLVPVFSTNHAVIASSQSVPAAAMAGIIGAIGAAVAGDEHSILATAVTAVAITTLLVGASTYLLGAFRLSSFIRFIPFPVVAGFLAGSGWLVFVGGIDAVAGLHVPGAPIALLMEPSMIVRAIAAAGFIFVVWAFQRLSSWRLALAVTIAAALVLFNLIVWIVGIPTQSLRVAHWLMALPDGHTLWPPIAPADLGTVDWTAIGRYVPSLLTIPVLAIIGTLMNSTGIELDSRRDLDLDSELRTVGVANLIAGAGGGTPGYHNLSASILASRLGSTSAVTGVTVAALCATAVVFGSKILSLVPTPLLGGVLIWVGGGLVRQWLFLSYRRLALAEYAVVVLIFAIIGFVGFVWGILAGLLAAAALFLIEYGRVDIIRYTLSGRDYQSRVDTSEERLELLRGHGEAILLFRLQGFLFFGTADRLRKTIQRHILAHVGKPIRFLVIDFQRVSGLDSSAVLSFARLAQMAPAGGFTLVLTGMTEQVATAMRRGEVSEGQKGVHTSATFDDGVEWCENALLAEVAPERSAARTRPARDMLIEIVGEASLAEALMPYFERIEFGEGEVLIAQGQPSDDIYFIEAGRAAVELASNSQSVRLATVSHGAIVGEIAFYLTVPRSASVVAETKVVAWRFSRANMDRLRESEPEIAARFHAGIAAMLADRLTRTNRLIQLLAD